MVFSVIWIALSNRVKNKCNALISWKNRHFYKYTKIRFKPLQTLYRKDWDSAIIAA